MTFHNRTQHQSLYSVYIPSNQHSLQLLTDCWRTHYSLATTSNISSSSSCAIAGWVAPRGSAVLSIDRKQREMGGAVPWTTILCAGTCRDQTAHKISSPYTFTHYEFTKIWKARSSVENRVVWWVSGHLRSPVVSPFDTVRTTSYLTLIEAMRLSCTIFKLLTVVCQKSPIFTYPTCIFWRPRLVTPFEFRRDLIWRQKKWRRWAIMWRCIVISCLAILTQCRCVFLM